MCSEKYFALGIIFITLNPVPSLLAPTQMHYNTAFDSLELCKTICAEAKGNSKFHDDSLTCFCELPKTTADAIVNLLTKKAQENGLNLEVVKRNSNAKRETNLLELAEAPTVLDDKVPNSAEKQWSSFPSNLENVLGQAPPNTVPRRQQQIVKPVALQSEPAESTVVHKQRPPLLINKKTSALSDVKEIEPEAPNLKMETDVQDIFGEEVSSKKANKRQFDFDNFLEQASINSFPQHQQQNAKGPTPNESSEVSNQELSNISNKTTLALSDVVKESEPDASSSWKNADMHHMFDNKLSQVPRNTADKRQIHPRVDFEDTLGQASPNIPQDQHQNIRGSSLTELTDVTSQRSPNTSNKKTSSLSDVKKEENLEASNFLNEKDFGDDLRLASPNTLPQRQQNTESNELKILNGEPVNASNQRPPNISNKKIETMQVKSLSSSGQTSSKEMNNLQNDVVSPKITKRNSLLERESSLDDKVSRENAESILGQASLNTIPQLQQQKTKKSKFSEASSSQKPPIIDNKKTSALSEVVKESEDLQLITNGKPKVSSTSPTTVNFVGASSGLLANMIGEEEPTSSSKQTTRRSTPSPRKSPALKRTYNNEPIRRALETARQHIDTLIQRTNQPLFNPTTMAAEIEAICASLRSVSHRMNESSRNLERSALMEQIRERERERHARIHSRFGGGHEDRPRKLKPLLVGTANPKDKGAASKTEDVQGKKDELKESGSQKAPTIITQPPELVDN